MRDKSLQIPLVVAAGGGGGGGAGSNSSYFGGNAQGTYFGVKPVDGVGKTSGGGWIGSLLREPTQGGNKNHQFKGGLPCSTVKLVGSESRNVALGSNTGGFGSGAGGGGGCYFGGGGKN